MTEVPRRIAELIDYMDDTRRRLMETGCDKSALASIRPHEGTWSAAEIVAHLAKVEAGVAPMVEKSVAWARSHGIGPASSDSLSCRASIPIVLRNSNKMEAPNSSRRRGYSYGRFSPLTARVTRAAQSRAARRADLDLTQVKRPHAW